MRDSAQLFALAPPGASHWLDMGAGGGLPGIVIAILAAEQEPELRITLLESDERKAVFLNTAKRSLGLSYDVVNARIEAADPVGADVISARALAPLERLLCYAERHRAPDAICLFPKGRTHAEELTHAKNFWHVDAEAIQSRTNPESVVLRIKEFSRV